MNRFDYNDLDLKEAIKFLETLRSYDSDNSFTFQTFDDSSARRKNLCKVLNGTFEEHCHRLVELNKAGAGIFVTVNRTNSSGRKSENIIALRSVFVDSDNGPLPPLKILPSMIIQSSPMRQHGYWLLHDGQPLDLFSKVQKGLISNLNTDPTIHDLPRVMRLPGFYHQKDSENPFLVKLLEIKNVRYSLDEILEVYPLSEGQEKKSKAEEEDKNFSRFRAWVNNLPTTEGAKNEFGGRHNVMVLIAREGLGSKIPEDELLKVIQEYCVAAEFEIKEAFEIYKNHKKIHSSTPFESRLKSQSETLALIVARQYLKEFHPGEGRTLLFHNEDFYRYTGTHFSQMTKKELKTHFVSSLQGNVKLKTGSFIRDSLGHVEGLCYLPSEIKLSTWIDTKAHKGTAYIPIKNGIMEILPFKENLEFNFLNHTPAFFSTNCLPYSYVQSTECNHWLKFLQEMVPDQETRDFLQEWFGYCLISDTSFAKFVLLVGEGANGKSVICTVLKELLGEENVSGIELEAFNPVRTFPLAATVGKLANIVEELNEINKTAEGMLKKYVSGGLITIERKHRDAFNFWPTARITYATNVLPRFTDRSDGLWRRLIIIMMDVQILDESKQNKNLIKGTWWRESGELPGVFNWALLGLERLLKRGKFVEPKRSIEAKRNYKLEANPAKTFLIDYCSPNPKGEVTSRQLYNNYSMWCDDTGRKPLAEPQFAQEVKRVYPPVMLSKHPQRINGGRSRVWSGIELIDPNSAAF